MPDTTNVQGNQSQQAVAPSNEKTAGALGEGNGGTTGDVDLGSIPDTSGLAPQERLNKALEYISETEAAEAKGSEEETSEPQEAGEEKTVSADSSTGESTDKSQKEPSATEKFLSRLDAAKQRRMQAEQSRSTSTETETLKKEVEALRTQLQSLLTNPSEALLKMGKDPVAYVDRIANFKPESPEEKAVRERREYDESLQREINNLKEQINGMNQTSQSAQELSVRHQVTKKAEAVGEDGVPLYPYAYSEYSTDQIFSRAVEMAKEVGSINAQRRSENKPPLSYSDEEILAAVDLEAKNLYIDRENRRKKAKLTAREEEAVEERVGRLATKARTNITSAIAGQRATGKALTPDERRREAERYLASQGFR